MNVKNDFPDVDRVLAKLREYVDYFETKQKGELTEEEKEDCEYALKQVDGFISAVENYLDCVCNNQDRILRYKEAGKTVDEIQFYTRQCEDRRTRCHSEIIKTMVLIDRMAKRDGISKVFDYAEEFENNYGRIAVTTGEQKKAMTLREGIKRREMGNFGLYIAASVSVGLEMSDREVRAFASCESGRQSDESKIAFDEVKSRLNERNVKKVSKNLNDMIY